MKILRGFLIFLFFAVILSSCRSTPTPPQGWRSPVYKLLINDSNLPSNWVFNETESITSTDPTTNHVSRSWIEDQGQGIAWESIWRAYTIGDAIEKYRQLSQEYRPTRKLEPETRIYVEFTTPSEISFHSQIADEFYIACGWLDRPYCLTIARYRNYIVELRTDHKAELNGTQAGGLTYTEIETLIKVMDTKLVEFLPSISTATP